MLYIILLFVFVVVVVYLMMLMRRQKEKMSEIKIQIDQLQAQHDRLQKERDQLQERMAHCPSHAIVAVLERTYAVSRMQVKRGFETPLMQPSQETFRVGEQGAVPGESGPP